jgi:hypothetical protein
VHTQQFMRRAGFSLDQTPQFLLGQDHG